MSERIHSDPMTPAAPRGSRLHRRWLPWLAGTGVAVVVAAVAIQLYRAEPGVAQARGPQETGTARVGGGPATDEIVARVNNEPIAYEQLARECVEKYGAEVLDNIINRRLIEQECERAGLRITQAEIEQEVLTIATKFNIDVANWYALLKSERGIGQLQYHRDVIFPMLALKKLAGQNVDVAPQDLQRAYEREYGPRVEARMILVAGNIRQANDVWQKAMANPDDFGRLAREVSADPNTRPLGGVVPPIRRHGGNDEVEKVAFELRIGEISPVIDVGQGRYVILKCEGHTKPVATSLAQVESDLREQLIEEKTQQAVARVFEAIKQRSTIVNYVSGTSTGASQAGARTPSRPQAAGPQAAPQQSAATGPVNR